MSLFFIIPTGLGIAILAFCAGHALGRASRNTELELAKEKAFKLGELQAWNEANARMRAVMGRV